MKKILTVAVLIIIVSVLCTTVFAITSDTKPSDPLEGTVSRQIQQKTKDIWATVVVIVQIASVAAVVFAGLRYMFSSADQRADIKQGLIYLAIGAVLVFGATLVIRTVTTGFNQITK